MPSARASPRSGCRVAGSGRIRRRLHAPRTNDLDRRLHEEAAGRRVLIAGNGTGGRVRITRRRLLTLGGTAAVGLSLPRWSARAAAPLRTMHPEEGTAGYTSRPDLRPPPISIASPADGTAPGFIFLAPFPASAASTPSTSTPPPRSASHSGPLIVDDQGEVVWFLPMTEATAMNFRVQRFRGRPVLTWYEGRVLGPYGGSFVIYDPTYHQVARVKAGRGRHGD